MARAVLRTIQTFGRRAGSEHVNSRKCLNQFIDLPTLLYRCLDLLIAFDLCVVFPIKEWIPLPALFDLNDFSHHNSAPVIKEFESLLDFLE